MEIIRRTLPRGVAAVAFRRGGEVVVVMDPSIEAHVPEPEGLVSVLLTSEVEQGAV